jgi:hypothetical protein
METSELPQNSFGFWLGRTSFNQEVRPDLFLKEEVMARLTEAQRRRIREENLRRRAARRPLMTDIESAAFIGVTYDPGSNYGGADHSNSSCDSGSSSCGGGGGCD